jgi:uncharacterized protein YjbI with pentapeptide repeats
MVHQSEEMNSFRLSLRLEPANKNVPESVHHANYPFLQAELLLAFENGDTMLWQKLVNNFRSEDEAFYTDFDNANLAGMDVSAFDLMETHFDFANLQRAKLCTKLTYSTFRGADLRGTDFSGADLSYTTLLNAKIDEDTNFTNAVLIDWEDIHSDKGYLVDAAMLSYQDNFPCNVKKAWEQHNPEHAMRLKKRLEDIRLTRIGGV